MYTKSPLLQYLENCSENHGGFLTEQGIKTAWSQSVAVASEDNPEKTELSFSKLTLDDIKERLDGLQFNEVSCVVRDAGKQALAANIKEISKVMGQEIGRDLFPLRQS